MSARRHIRDSPPAAAQPVADFNDIADLHRRLVLMSAKVEALETTVTDLQLTVDSNEQALEAMRQDLVRQGTFPLQSCHPPPT